MRRNALHVEGWKQMVRAVAAAHADNGANVVANEHLFQLCHPALHRTGEVQVVLKDGRIEDGAVAESAQSLASGLELCAIKSTGRSDDSDSIPWPQRRRSLSAD